MRIISSGKIEYLSIRMEGVPGLLPSTITYVNNALADKSLGIRSDRRYFLIEIPKAGMTITKVYLVSYIYNNTCYKFI